MLKGVLRLLMGTTTLLLVNHAYRLSKDDSLPRPYLKKNRNSEDSPFKEEINLILANLRHASNQVDELLQKIELNAKLRTNFNKNLKVENEVIYQREVNGWQAKQIQNLENLIVDRVRDQLHELQSLNENCTGAVCPKFVNYLKESIKKIAVGQFKHFLFSANPQDVRGDLIFDAIYLYDIDFFQEVFNAFANDSDVAIGFETLMALNSNFTYVGQTLCGFVTLIDQVKNDINDQAVGKLAVYMNAIANEKSVQENPVMKKKMDYILQYLPKSVVNLLFARIVCIKNVEHSEYLHTEEITYDDETRNAFTLPEKQKWELNSLYHPERKRKFFHLKNSRRNEYLEAGHILVPYEEETCFKANQRVGGIAHVASAFEIFPTVNGFKIKSGVYNDSYLTTCGPKEGKHVLGTGSDDKTSSFLWEFEDCSEVVLVPPK